MQNPAQWRRSWRAGPSKLPSLSSSGAASAQRCSVCWLQSVSTNRSPQEFKVATGPPLEAGEQALALSAVKGRRRGHGLRLGSVDPEANAGQFLGEQQAGPRNSRRRPSQGPSRTRQGPGNPRTPARGVGKLCPRLRPAPRRRRVGPEDRLAGLLVGEGLPVKPQGRRNAVGEISPRSQTRHSGPYRRQHRVEGVSKSNFTRTRPASLRWRRTHCLTVCTTASAPAGVPTPTCRGSKYCHA